MSVCLFLWVSVCLYTMYSALHLEGKRETLLPISYYVVAVLGPTERKCCFLSGRKKDYLIATWRHAEEVRMGVKRMNMDVLCLNLTRYWFVDMMELMRVFVCVAYCVVMSKWVSNRNRGYMLKMLSYMSLVPHWHHHVVECCSGYDQHSLNKSQFV